MSAFVFHTQSATYFVDMVDGYINAGYRLESMWYDKGWFRTTYYACFNKTQQPPQQQPKIEFIIGPISNKGDV